MKFEVNIDKKYFFILLGAILILVGAIYGYAQADIAPNPGHLFEEIEGVQAKLINGNCSEGEIVQSIDSVTGNVTCIANGVGDDSPQGLVLGGGVVYTTYGIMACYSWGAADCVPIGGFPGGSRFECPAETIEYLLNAPQYSNGDGFPTYLCITD